MNQVDWLSSEVLPPAGRIVECLGWDSERKLCLYRGFYFGQWYRMPEALVVGGAPLVVADVWGWRELPAAPVGCAAGAAVRRYGYIEVRNALCDGCRLGVPVVYVSVHKPYHRINGDWVECLAERWKLFVESSGGEIEG